MPVYQGAPIDPPPVPLIFTSTQVDPTVQNLQRDIEILRSYLDNLVLYLASYRPSIEVP